MLTDPVLQIENVSKRFGDFSALRNVSLKVKKQETVAILGPSGSGKTTLLRCINFLTPYDEGRIVISGTQIGYRERNGKRVNDTEKSINTLRKKIGFVFQRFNLFPHRTVLGNLVEGPIHVRGIPRAEAVERAMQMLDLVGLSGKIDSYPDSLSGGQQQRVGIARALCMEPDIILFDEATSALDPELVDEVLQVIRNLASRGLTMMLVTHEVAFARDIADRIIFMDSGKVLADMKTQQFFENPENARIEQFLRRHNAGNR